jgi:hypothetical protein
MDDRRRRYLEGSIGLTRDQVKQLIQRLGRIAFLAQRRYFQVASEVLLPLPKQLDELPPEEHLDRLLSAFAAFKQLQEHVEQARRVLPAFDSAVVPDEFE